MRTPHKPASTVNRPTSHPSHAARHLQVFQLGALFPAAAFDHGDCLRYMDPLGVDLKLVRTTIVAFGYSCWASLVVIGLLSLLGLAVHVGIHMCLLGSTTLCSGSLQRYWNAFISPCTSLHERIFRAGEEEPCSPCCKIFTLYLAIASVPMFIAGSALGFLVIVGQVLAPAAPMIATNDSRTPARHVRHPPSAVLLQYSHLTS